MGNNTDEKTAVKRERHLILDHPVLLALIFPFFGQMLAVVLSALPMRILFLNKGMPDDRTAIMNAALVIEEIFQLLLIPVFFMLVKRGLGKKFCFGFHKKNLWEGFVLAWPALLFTIFNGIWVALFKDLSIGIIDVAAAALFAASAGFYEEACCRGIALSNMMRKWRNRPSCIYLSLLMSAAAFGLIHLTNSIGQGNIITSAVQMVYCIGFGILYGAVYLRTRNLWGIAILHFLFDFPGAIGDRTLGEPTDILVLVNLIFLMVVAVACTVVGLYLVRKEKREPIKALWADAFTYPDGTEK